MIQPHGQVTRLSTGDVIDSLGRRCIKSNHSGIPTWIVAEPIAYPVFNPATETASPPPTLTARAGDLPHNTAVITSDGTRTTAGKLPPDTLVGDPSLLPNAAGLIGSHPTEGSNPGDAPPQGAIQRSGRPITATEVPKPEG